MVHSVLYDDAPEIDSISGILGLVEKKVGNMAKYYRIRNFKAHARNFKLFFSITRRFETSD